MSAFKKGDRVRLTSAAQQIFGCAGKQGTIAHSPTHGIGRVGVRWDGRESAIYYAEDHVERASGTPTPPPPRETSPPHAGQTWVSDPNLAARAEYIVLAVAYHTSRIDQLVVYRAAYGQRQDSSRVWATPMAEFANNFKYEPNPRHPETRRPRRRPGAAR